MAAVLHLGLLLTHALFVLLIFHHITIFLQKVWLPPKLFPEIEIQDGGCPPSSIIEKLITEQWIAFDDADGDCCLGI